ncbi:MAG: DUF362 domain-containing protein [Deltaproteobacteria bacterium]|nr:DUF362 domain-containing protein [Deltaproteobacteria bacterium]
MDRRYFLKLLAGASALAVSSCAGNAASSRTPRIAEKPAAGGPAEVFAAGVEKDSPEQLIKHAVRDTAEAATDFSWLYPGDVVFIKPVLNSGYPYPSTTSPVAIAAMVELLREKGAARVIVGDMSGVEHVKLSPDGLKGSSRSLMEKSGMAEAVQASGAELHFFEEAGWDAFYEETPTAGDCWNGGLMMPKILKEADHIVLMPRCGRHVLAGSTLGLKAAVGYWRADTRLEYHHNASTFHEKTAEANTVETLLKKQRLVLTAADRILTTFGPDKGYVLQPETGLVIASTSIVAHDMVSLAWLLENRRVIPESEQNGFLDTSTMVAGYANRYVVSMLGGFGKAMFSEPLIKNDVKSIFDDRILNHAYHIFGGVPDVIIKDAGNPIPESLKNRLAEMTAFQG